MKSTVSLQKRSSSVPSATKPGSILKMGTSSVGDLTDLFLFRFLTVKNRNVKTDEHYKSTAAKIRFLN